MSDEHAPDFQPPVDSPGLPGYGTLEAGNNSGYGEIATVTRDPRSGEAIVTATNASATQYPWGKETWRESIEHRTFDDDPARTAMRGSHRIGVELDDRRLAWEAELDFSSDAQNFYYDYTRRLYENGELKREKRWTRTIPRDHQ